MARKKVSRRGFLRCAVAGAGASALAPAAAVPAQEQQEPKPPPRYCDYLGEKETAGDTLPLTEENIEGPFYRPGAPFRTKLYEEGDRGDVLNISGTVVARNGRPIKDAVLDVWNTTAAGRYDNDDPDNPPPVGVYHMRARIKTDENGRFEFETIRPGHYAMTPVLFRTAHVHFRVSAEGYRPLTSQFFFKGETYNKTDPWFKPSMVLDLKPQDGKYMATVRIVLATA